VLIADYDDANRRDPIHAKKKHVNFLDLPPSKPVPPLVERSFYGHFFAD
jgi:hypothetical protein